jgi:hypothetical protein
MRAKTRPGAGLREKKARRTAATKKELKAL